MYHFRVRGTHINSHARSLARSPLFPMCFADYGKLAVDTVARGADGSGQLHCSPQVVVNTVSARLLVCSEDGVFSLAER